MLLLSRLTLPSRITTLLLQRLRNIDAVAAICSYESYETHSSASLPSSTAKPDSPPLHPPRAHIIATRIPPVRTFPAHPVAATSPLCIRHCAVGEPCGQTRGLGVNPALFSRTDADKDAENEAAGRVSSARARSSALRPMRGGLLLGVHMQWTTRTRTLGGIAHPPCSRSPTSLVPLPSSPLRAALFSEPYGDDTDTSRSTTSHLACGLPFTPRCVWTGTEYGPAPTTYDNAHSQPQLREGCGHGGRAVACALMSMGMERALPELEL
ncbi:hypothetical protein B0H13DRAFT_2353501 [Mycena leptocephala]|nr:hypothetical protein B0H13DRAFT_2353501 [Mycena leptocephala]